MTSTAIARKRRFVALLATVALVAPACGGGGGDDEVAVTDDAVTTTSAPTTTTTVEDGGDVAGEGSRSPTTTRPPDDSGTPQGDGGEAPSDPAAAQPTTPGLYEYDTDGHTRTSGGLSNTDELPEVTTLTVEEPDGARQRSVRDLRNADGDGSITTTDLVYRDDGTHIAYLEITVTNSGVTFTFEFVFDPPEPVLPTGADVGFHTEFSTESTDGGIRADVEIDVTDREAVTIAGERLDTLVLVTHILFEGDVDGESTSRDNIDVDRSLRVREDFESDAEFGVAAVHTEYVATSATSARRSRDATMGVGGRHWSAGEIVDNAS